jgi:hypothetical protein
VPAPAGPARTVRWAMASNTGAQRSRASSGPAASTVSLPCSAGPFVPVTGASTKTTPCRSASAAQRSVSWTPTVEAWIHSAPSAADGKAASATARTASAR